MTGFCPLCMLQLEKIPDGETYEPKGGKYNIILLLKCLSGIIQVTRETFARREETKNDPSIALV